MHQRNPRSLPAIVVAAIALTGVLSRPASAQERPAPVVEFAVGALSFPDDGAMVKEGFVGGAGRFYLSPRISAGPEISSIHGDNHSHLVLTGNLTVDLVAPVRGRPRPVTPFVVAGGGLFRTTEHLLGRGDFTSSEGAFTVGGGVRALVGERILLGAEARIGWEAHLRVNATIGFRLGAS